MFSRKHATVFAPLLLTLFASVGCAVDTGADPESTGQAAEAVSVLTGTFVLQVEGKCMDVPAWNVTAGTRVYDDGQTVTVGAGQSLALNCQGGSPIASSCAPIGGTFCSLSDADKYTSNASCTVVCGAQAVADCG